MSREDDGGNRRGDEGEEIGRFLFFAAGEASGVVANALLLVALGKKGSTATTAEDASPSFGHAIG